MKRIFIKLFLIVFFTAAMNIGIYASCIYNISDINITANGNPVSMSVKPINKNGSILVPAKDIFETLGYKADIRNDIEQLYVHFGNKTLVFTADSDIAYINGVKTIMDSEARIINGSMLIPLKFLHNSLGLNVAWDKDSDIVYIDMSKNSNDKVYREYYYTDSYIFTDDKGNIIAEYPQIHYAGCNVYVFRDKNNKMGVLDSEGKVIVEAKYTDDMNIASRTFALNNTITLKEVDRFDIYDTSGKLKKSVTKPVGFKKSEYSPYYSCNDTGYTENPLKINCITGSNVVISEYMGDNGGPHISSPDDEEFIIRLFSEKKVDGYYNIKALSNGEFTAIDKKDGKNVTLNIDGSLKYKY